MGDNGNSGFVLASAMRWLNPDVRVMPNPLQDDINVPMSDSRNNSGDDGKARWKDPVLPN